MTSQQLNLDSLPPHIYIIIINPKPQQASLKGTISLEGQEKRKYKKICKSRSKEKVVGFTSASLFPARKWKAVTQDGIKGIDYLMKKRTQ